jgi:hypothetical protein
LVNEELFGGTGLRAERAFLVGPRLDVAPTALSGNTQTAGEDVDI